MTQYLLDTNIISDVIRRPQGAAASRLMAVSAEDLFTSIVVASELRYGVERARSERLRDRVNMVLLRLQVLPLAPPVDEVYEWLQSTLERSGLPIGGNDLFLAAHALAGNFTLVTNNTREFDRVPDLVCENWVK